MQFQSPISIAANADYLRRYSHFAAHNGRGIPISRTAEILACADRMEASKTPAEYEAALADAHRLGMFPIALPCAKSRKRASYSPTDERHATPVNQAVYVQIDVTGSPDDRA